VKFKVEQDYAQRRREDYPDIREQLDAIWKGGPDAELMRQKILAVKDQYPKPDGDNTQLADKS
jgi:hypothetical protein